ncbi:hypothetical protein BH23PLA1_BH23PLA1_16030 [soil metagenome]
MPLHARIDGDVAILSNVGRSMNDPRYTDAGREVGELLDQKIRNFIIELRGVQETGPPLLGVLMTISRQVRNRGGEVVLADVSRPMLEFLTTMQMDDHWDVFRSVADARRFFEPGTDRG